MLLHKTVAQDNGIVNRQRQLQHHRNGIGDAGDGPQPVVGPLVQNGRHAKGNQQHRNFHICFCGKQQHRNDYNHGQHQDQIHVLCQGFARFLFRPDLRRHIGIVVRQRFPDRVHGILAYLLLFLSGKSNVIKSIGPRVMILGIVKSHFLHALDRFQLIHQLLSIRICNIGHHHPGAAIGQKLLLHQIQPPVGLTVRRQIFGNILIHRNLIDRNHAVNNRNKKEHINGFTFVDNKCGHRQPEIPFFFFLFHRRHLLSYTLSHFHKRQL